MICICACLVAVNLLALGCGLRVRAGSRIAWVGLAAAFWLGVVDGAWPQAPWAVEKWWTGGAYHLFAGLPADPSALGTDPETRLDWSESCFATRAQATVRNTTLQLLHRHVGPAAGTWQGRYPSAAEATAMLHDRGATLAVHLETTPVDPELWASRGLDGPPRFVEGGVFALDNRTLRFYRAPHLGCDDLVAPRAYVRVARLDPTGLVVGCGPDVEVYVEALPGVYAPLRLGRAR